VCGPVSVCKLLLIVCAVVSGVNDGLSLTSDVNCAAAADVDDTNVFS